VPIGPLAGAWQRYRQDLPLISAAQKRQLRVLVVGSGLAGASAAASLAEQGFKVSLITYHDSPRRAHSVAAQGGINAAKNYANDGDSVTRLFRDTVKGGDFRAREAGCFRLAELSTAIIDQCVAQGVPFAREYGGTLANRSFGGTLVSRTFYARGQTGQQLLYGAVQGLLRQVQAGRIDLLPRRDLVELPAPRQRRTGDVHSECRGVGEWWLFQRLLPLHQCGEEQRQRPLAGLSQRG
jgi:succinate dehydrogenase / fumarate reductase flavoprotein subunit